MPGADNEIKCALSEAYICALGTVSGFPCTIGKRELDLLKFDAHFTVRHDFGPQSLTNLFTVYVQLKATSAELAWKKARLDMS
jgi:hypothetical protein